MKHTYRIHVQRQYQPALYGRSMDPLSKEALAKVIEGVLVREIAMGNDGKYVVDLQLQRPTHEEALNDILVALQQLGYSWLQATVTEWADNAIGGFVLGGLGCGAAGTKSGSGEANALLALVGAVVGAIVGSFIESVKVEYEVRWNGYGWQLAQVQPAPANSLQPRLA